MVVSQRADTLKSGKLAQGMGAQELLAAGGCQGQGQTVI